ncbi:DUF3459 domain-containing protein [bacterium]|nr:DUF3459 domain-containing protein [bacterium]
MSTSTLEKHVTGMGATLHEHGTAFRVWAPNADSVSVVGTFNDWDEEAHPLEREDNGYWYADVPSAAAGDEYRYMIRNGDQRMSRIDPYAREVTNSVGNSVICDTHFDWEGVEYQLPPRETLVIYELHIGTFGRKMADDQNVADFEAAIGRLDHLQRLGINCIEVMPVAEFAGDLSWGYNPAQPFAVESTYGGPAAFKKFVREAHRRGIGVILDVVYNHFGPSDLSLWQFDGWSENGGGGIYFYNDWRAATPWGSTRPDYGRPEVRQYLRDNALMWIDEYQVDGLRLDMTLYVRNVSGSGNSGDDLPDGWGLTQWLNDEVKRHRPDALTIAEDLQNNEWLTKTTGEGGAGFSAQWDAQFVHPIRDLVIMLEDDHRSMDTLRAALEHRYNGDPFQRVIYTESHDEVANGKARVPAEIDPDDGTDWYARKRSTLGAVVVLTAPGIPMLFQGQEFLQDGWFQDTLPLDWHRTDEYRGIVRLYRDLIALRTNANGDCRALQGAGFEVVYQDNGGKTFAFRRWRDDNPNESLMILLNFHREARDIECRFAAGRWEPVFNSDAAAYGNDFSNSPTDPIEIAEDQAVKVHMGSYSAVIYRKVGS